MQYNMMMKAMGSVLNGMVRPVLKNQTKAISAGYKEILLRAADIGAKNKLLSSYMLAAYFISMTRNTGLSPEENLKILQAGMEKSRMLKLFMGNADSYFSEKNMQSRREWSKQTHQHTYPNDWVVDVLEKTPDYEFGFNYLECGVCKLCRDEGCPELAKYLCSLDFMLVEIMGIRLKRTQTLAEGGEFCDFRFSRQ